MLPAHPYRVVLAVFALLGVAAASQFGIVEDWPVRVTQVNGQHVFPEPEQTLPRIADKPRGFLSDRVGAFHTIEGFKYDGPGGWN